MTLNAKFVLSRSKLLEQYNKITDIGTVSYSVKTNPIAAQILEKETDCMFCIHTENELEYVKDTKRIWFLAESWTLEQIEKLYSLGIRNFAIHNKNDLNKLIEFMEHVEEKINLLLRMKLREHSIFTEKYFVFGFDSKTVNELIPGLKNNDKINKLGIHFHRKSENVGEWSLKYELSNALTKETLKAIDIMNIGGGLPIKYKNISDIAITNILKKIQELKQWLSEYNIEIITEPGRFLSGPAIELVTRIINLDNKTITVNASIYNTAMDTLIVPHRLLVKGEREHKSEDIKEYTIKGSTPCNLDMFRYSVFLPEMEIGDEIIFENAGAYNFATLFCNLSKLETEIID
ncbi:decarboxylase [archaeon]|nr:decarboxylase [archaeon]